MFQTTRRLHHFSRFLAREIKYPCSLIAHGSTQAQVHAVNRADRRRIPPRVETTLLLTKRFKHKFIPRKAAVKLTEKSRGFFRQLLDKPPRPNVIGIMLNHQQSQTGEPRMVFSFKFVTEKDIDRNLDEGVSLELVKEKDPATGSLIEVPKSPADSETDGLPKLYVHHDAFLKVLGATVDVDIESVSPILHDREGNLMDPNA